MKRKNIIVITISIITIVFSMSFTHTSQLYHKATGDYYDQCLDTLLMDLNVFKKACVNKKAAGLLKKNFLNCRNSYKKISFFVEQFDARSAREINGPDLLRIEEDTQQDSTLPHGFQHIEALLYGTSLNTEQLKAESDILISIIEKLKNFSDHKYYFRNDRIWEALRSGTYRIISLGITGFDVPLSLHALPETKIQLSSLRYVISLYKNEIEDKDPGLYNKAIVNCNKAIAFIPQQSDFNSFDRLTFIKDYINPLSACLKEIAISLSYINTRQLSPLNINAEHLFAPAIFNIAFFSPNERYRVTPARIALGEKLFYDTRLSGNNSRSCASCHKPSLAFTDGLAKGRHMDGTSDVLRNTPTLWNSVFQARQFYDSRALVLETQLSAVVHNEEEMGGSLQTAIPGLLNDTAYSDAFRTAYPGEKEPVSQYTIANAISSYVRSLVSFNSRFDKYIRRESDSFSQGEKNGFNLFMGKAKCGTCHYAPMFNGLVPPLYEESESEILAVPAVNIPKAILDADEGKYRYTKVPLHKYAFKTPGIRNSALTAPYMHNGAFKTLEEVIDFYDKGGGAGLGIRLDTQTLPADKLHLTGKEKKDIIAFLHALTDTSRANIIVN